MKQKTRLWIVAGILLACTFGVLWASKTVETTIVRASGEILHFPYILIDPGHGGIDGGAVSITGTPEKEINLSISSDLRDFLTVNGYSVGMTRENDRSLHDASATTTREIKVSDIHHRLALMKDHPDCIFISIHQNFFSESRYWGAQFFYSTSVQRSKELAIQLQTAFRQQLQPDNTREIKPCGKEIYLMYHANTAAVLAECGFLSNPKEAERLEQEDYQRQVAFSLFCGLLRYSMTPSDMSQISIQ